MAFDTLVRRAIDIAGGAGHTSGFASTVARVNRAGVKGIQKIASSASSRPDNPITPPGPTAPGPGKPTAIIPPPTDALTGQVVGPGIPFDPTQPISLGGDVAGSTGITGINIGSGGIGAQGTVAGIPISVQIPLGGGSEPATGQPAIPGFTSDPASAGNCPQGTISIPGLGCVDVVPGGAHQGSGMIVSPGEGAVGMVGLGAVNPTIMQETVRRCPRGMVLGIDNLCYHKGALTKATRKWNPGRRPLLTGGDLNAISRAARAANRMKAQQKKLEKLGLLKKPKRGSSRKPQFARARAIPEAQFTVIDTD